MENHNHQASLKAFCSHASFPNSKPELDSVSLSWIQNCFDYMFNLNKAFATLVVEIDYPMSKWEVQSTEEYLSYSLRILDLLNSVKSCISQVSHAQVSMSYALSLIETSVPTAMEQLSSIDFKSFKVNLKSEKDFKEENFSEKDLIIHQALMEMKKNCELVFATILLCFSGDMKPYTGLEDSEGSTERSGLLEEFKKINEAKACLLAAMETRNFSKNNDVDVKKLEAELEEVQKQLDDIGSKADDLFSEILAARHEVLDVFGQRNQYN